MKFSIQLKIVSVIVLVLLAGTAASVYITTDNQRRNLLESAERLLSVNTDILNITIRNLMIAGQAPIAKDTMAGLQTGVSQLEEIAIYRVDGSIAFNDYQTLDFVNSYQEDEVFPRTERVERVVLDSPQFQEVLATNSPVKVESVEKKELEYFFPILNRRECRGCHGETPFIRGVAHFRISVADVYQQIADARTTLALIFLGIGAVIAGLLILSVHRVIVSPILTIGRTARIVGQGNLDARIDLKSRDELGDLAGQLNGMIAGLEERNELRLTNTVVEARNAENRKYLDNIQEGLLLMDRRLTISAQYSRYLLELFGVQDIAGMSFVDFIYPDAVAQAEEREELEKFLSMVINNTSSDMEMILSINPLKDRTLRVGEPARTIVVDTMFHRIVQDEVVENVMAIFQDRTEITQVQEALKVERERSESEIAQIAVLLRAGPQAFIDFVAQANTALDELEARRRELGSRAVLDQLFRSMHSLKGAARYLDFRRIETSAHDVEDLISALRSGAPVEDAQERLTAMIGLIREEIDGVRKINERFRDFATSVPAQAEVEPVTAIMERMTQSLAAELGKKVRFVAEGKLDNPDVLASMRDAVIHLLRNAVDHGIEEPLDRVGAGKTEEGTIRLTLQTEGGNHLIQVADDGRGIDFEAVRRRAEERRLVGRRAEDATRATLLRVIFLPGFSSRSQVTGTSGRGVGLDVVHDAVKKLGGQISVMTDDGKGVRMTLRIPAV